MKTIVHTSIISIDKISLFTFLEGIKKYVSIYEYKLCSLYFLSTLIVVVTIHELSLVKYRTD